MYFYVAGKVEDWEKVREVRECLEQAGHHVTYDWTLNVEAQGAGPTDHEVARKWANADVNGVETAHAVFVVPHRRHTGTLIELGIALSKRKPIYVLGTMEDMRYSIFYHRPEFVFIGDLLGLDVPEPSWSDYLQWVRLAASR